MSKENKNEKNKKVYNTYNLIIRIKNYFYNFYFATTYLNLRVTDDMNLK